MALNLSPEAASAIVALRGLIWQRGFRPMPVYSHTHEDPVRAGKAPLGNEWEKRARQDPPECIRIGAAVAWADNTGILCDGLRAIDIDIDDPGIAGAIRALTVTMLGSTIVRTRENSPRCLLVYRAAEGEPVKLAVVGAAHTRENACKVEALGRGQQFVAYGVHPSKAELQWLDGGPADYPLDSIRTITEERLRAFMNAAAALIGAKPLPGPRGSGQRATGSGQEGAGNGHYDHEAGPVELRDVAAALQIIPNSDPADWEAWNKVGLAIFAATQGSDAGRDLWLGWSAKHPDYDEDHALKRWEHYPSSPPDRTGAGKLFAMAGLASPGWRRPSLVGQRAKMNGNGAYHDPEPGPQPGWDRDVPPPEPDPGEQDQPRDPLDDHHLPTIPWVDRRISDWDETELPERLWVVPGWIPREQVTGLYGPPGVNKTDFLIQLLMATSRGLVFMGFRLEQMPVFGLFCEDTDIEIARRAAKMAAHYGLRLSDFPDFHYASLVGFDDLEFVTFDRNAMHESRALKRFDKKIAESGAAFACLDTAPHFFGGSEIDRRQVSRFLRKLDAISIGRGCGIMITAHPSQSGKKSGRMESGSTGWEGGVRARIALTRVDEAQQGEEDKPPVDNKDRRLTLWKSNYAPPGQMLDLICERGVFTTAALDPEKAQARGPARNAACEEKFLELLRAVISQGGYVHDSANVPARYAPGVFASRPEGKVFTRPEYKRAMDRLLGARKLRYEKKPGGAMRLVENVQEATPENTTTDG